MGPTERAVWCGAEERLSFTVQGLAVGDVTGDDSEEIVLAQDGSQNVKIRSLVDGALQPSLFQVGLQVHQVGVMQLDGEGQEEVVVNPIEDVPDPFVEIWDASTPALRLALQVEGVDSVEFVDAPKAWPQEGGGDAYVPPHLWILPRRDPEEDLGPEWPCYAAFWPPDP